MIEELNNYDWGCAFEYAGEKEGRYTYGDPDIRKAARWIEDVSLDPFTREDVERIAFLLEGENDGPNWVCVGQLKDGRWFSLSAGCDYTGWDCRAGGHASVANSLLHIVRYGLGDSERVRIIEEYLIP